VGATALGGQAVGASGRELKRLWRIPLVVIEVGYVPFDPEAVALFFELVSSRYDRTSMIVSPNKTVSGGAHSSGGGRTGPAAGDPVQRGGWRVPIAWRGRALLPRRATPSDR